MTMGDNVQKSTWLQFSSPAELVAKIAGPTARLDHVVGRLKDCAEQNNGRLPDHVTNVGSRLLFGSNTWRDSLRSFVLRPNDREEPFFKKYTTIKPLRLDLVGHVYFVKSALRPEHVKIGFTTRIPEVRVRTLESNSGEKLELMGWFVGTLLDEQILHCINRESHVVSEWYVKPKWFPTTNSGAIERPWDRLIGLDPGIRPQ